MKELGLGYIPPEETETPTPKQRTRKARKLAWNERQYGAGFIHGLWCGIGLGMPLAAGVATLCHYFVGWLIG